VEPFFEGTSNSYILLLRESNEKMLTEFINLDRRQIAFDLSNPTDKTDFFRSYSSMISKIPGGETALSNAFNRTFSSQAPCNAVSPGSTSIASMFTSLGSTIFSSWNTTISSYTDLNNLTFTATDTDDTITTKLRDAGTAYAVKALNEAQGSTSLYAPWTCNTSVGCTQAPFSRITPTAITSTTLPSYIGASMTTSISTIITTYKTKTNASATDHPCGYDAYYMTKPFTSTGSTWSCSLPSLDVGATTTLKTSIDNSIKEYIKGDTFQVNPGFSCSAIATTGYVPTYLSTTGTIPKTASSSETQTNPYYNGIMIGSTIAGTTYIVSIIANEVGQAHIGKLLANVIAAKMK